MSTSVFMRSVGSLALTWGAIACAPDGLPERDSSAIDSVAAADQAAPDTPAATPDSTAPATAAPDTVRAVIAPPAAGAIRTLPTTGAIRDGRDPRIGGRDSAITPDFNDPSKRLPPAP